MTNVERVHQLRELSELAGITIETVEMKLRMYERATIPAYVKSDVRLLLNDIEVFKDRYRETFTPEVITPEVGRQG